MSGIFISYRRHDGQSAAGRLADDLAEAFGPDQIFRDIAALEAGVDFAEALRGALASCAAMLVVIGPDWVRLQDASGQRRLDDPQDWVRREIAAGLERKIRVFPLLVEGAAMPTADALPEELRPLAERQAFEITDRHWRLDVASLEATLAKVPGIVRIRRARFAPFGRRAIRWSLAGLAMVIALAAFLQIDPLGLVAPAASADLSPWVRVRDSGPEGSVVGIATAMAMETALARDRRPAALSARYLYEKSKRVDRWGPEIEGGSLEAALYVAEHFGVPPEELWPYQSESRELPAGVTWEILDRAAEQYKARAYRVARLEDIASHLRVGQPVVAAVDVRSKDWDGTDGEVIYHEDAQLSGHHAIVIVGYDASDGSFRFANSWGPNWGDRGFGRMTDAVARKIVRSGEMWAIEVPPSEKAEEKAP